MVPKGKHKGQLLALADETSWLSDELNIQAKKLENRGGEAGESWVQGQLFFIYIDFVLKTKQLEKSQK